MTETGQRILWSYVRMGTGPGCYLVSSSGGVLDPIIDAFTITVPETEAHTEDIEILVEALRRMVAREEAG